MSDEITNKKYNNSKTSTCLKIVDFPDSPAPEKKNFMTKTRIITLNNTVVKSYWKKLHIFLQTYSFMFFILSRSNSIDVLNKT